MSEASLPDIPLPTGWTKNVRSAVLHVVSLAHYALLSARGWAADALNPRARQAAEMDGLTNQVALLQEELRIKDSRIAKIDPRHRPHYPPAERMAILQLKAARGWSLAQTARVFLVEDETIAAWLKRIDEDGSSALVQLREPVNRFPDFVRYIVQQLKSLCPTLGKVKIAQVLARAGLHLCATTVARMLKAKTPPLKPTKRWCQRRKIRPRFGAVGQYGSIAVIERFLRTMKDEGLRRVLVPLNLRRMHEEFSAIIGWYNTHRPHSWLGGRTPDERYRRIPAACRRPRFEPRPHWPVSSGCASPQAKVRGKPGVRLELLVDYHDGQKHLPIVTLKRAA